MTSSRRRRLVEVASMMTAIAIANLLAILANFLAVLAIREDLLELVRRDDDDGGAS